MEGAVQIAFSIRSYLTWYIARSFVSQVTHPNINIVGINNLSKQIDGPHHEFRLIEILVVPSFARFRYKKLF